jgi:hypothetical protein
VFCSIVTCFFLHGFFSSFFLASVAKECIGYFVCPVFSLPDLNFDSALAAVVPVASTKKQAWIVA